MPRNVVHAKLESPRARAKLARGRQAHWQSLVPGGLIHIGWQAWPGAPAGRWMLRKYLGGGNRYSVTTLGPADDATPADGRLTLSFQQAVAAATAMIASPGKTHRLTVAQAIDRYVEFKASQGQPIADLLGRARAHILPMLGDLVVSELTAARLRAWHATLAASPPQTRPKAGKAQWRDAPSSDDEKRARKSSANRILTVLKAALNHCYDEGHVSDRKAWDRKLKPYKGVEAARVRYLSVAEAERLINASDPDFRPLVRAALETGARYGELTRLVVSDFNPDAGTLTIRKSKSGKMRHVVLTDQGAEFFRAHIVGRRGDELMFVHGSNGWKPSEQNRPMADAVARAKIAPPITFHGLRHSWASLAVMGGVPLMVVARNLGHVDTRMVERHYGHLAQSYVADTIRAGAPKFAVKTTKT